MDLFLLFMLHVCLCYAVLPCQGLTLGSLVYDVCLCYMLSRSGVVLD